MSNNYRCADGKWLMLAEPSSDLFWKEFCEAIELPALKTDPRFEKHLGGRNKYNEELIQILDKTFALKSRNEWIDIFNKRNVGFGYAPIYDISEAIEDPHD